MGIKPAIENFAANLVGVFQYGFITVRGADGADNALADAGDDCFFGGAADEASEVSADGNAGFDEHADSIFGNGVEHGGAFGWIWAIDDFWVNARADGVIDVAAGKVDCGSPLEVEFDIGFVGGD